MAFGLSRLRRRVDSAIDTGRRLVDDPRLIADLLRRRAMSLWTSRGGGFYGLGYVITFVVLEIRMFFGDVLGGSDVVGFLAAEVMHLVFRFAVDSFVNALQAFLWPVFVIDYLGGWGILTLLIGWLVYARIVAPLFAQRLSPSERSKDSIQR